MSEQKPQDRKNKVSKPVETTKAVKINKLRLSPEANLIMLDPYAVYKENKYFTNIASKFRKLKYAVISVALMFSVFMMTFYSKEITAENFRYLFKDFDFGIIGSSGAFSSVIYNGGTDSKFAIFRDELIVVNPGATYLYSSSGAVSFSDTNIFYDPSLVTSGKYFLVYDKGDTSYTYTVYNSFSQLKTDKLSYPITGAALCDSGAYAIITRSNDYRGEILLYDNKFKMIMKIQKDKYIISADIKSDGGELAVAALYDLNGDFYTELSLVRSGSKETLHTAVVPDSLPLKIRYMENGNIVVMYSDRMAYYNSELSEIKSVEYGTDKFVKCEIGNSAVCIVYNNDVLGNDKTACIYDSSGNEIYKTVCTGEFSKSVLYGNGKRCFLLFEEKIIDIDIEKGNETVLSIMNNAIDLVLTSNGTPIICYSGNAVNASLNDTETGEVTTKAPH